MHSELETTLRCRMEQQKEELIPFTNQTELTGYVPLPKSLLNRAIHPGALVLYSLLLDRSNLSQRSGWWNILGEVYVIYPLQDLALALHKSLSTIKRWMRELEKHGLVSREVISPGEACRIYLSLPWYSDAAEVRRQKASAPSWGYPQNDPQNDPQGQGSGMTEGQPRPVPPSIDDQGAWSAMTPK